MKSAIDRAISRDCFHVNYLSQSHQARVIPLFDVPNRVSTVLVRIKEILYYRLVSVKGWKFSVIHLL